MRAEQLEAWVLQIVDQVAEGHLVEDSRVELKADWPAPKKAARRIAGHANAAGSDSILWVVGLDEKNGVVPVAPTDLADWLPQLEAEFNGVAPKLKDLVVPTGSGSVTALLFDVTRRPFVVKNPAFGSAGRGPVSWEVPWRAGTSVRSARRDELLRILVPRQTLPSVELLKAYTYVSRRNNPASSSSEANLFPKQLAAHLEWFFHLKLYVTPQDENLLVLPTHKASLKFRFKPEDPVTADKFRFLAPSRSTGSYSEVPDSSTVTASSGEAVFSGPGLVEAHAYYYESTREVLPGRTIAATLTVAPAGSDLTTETTFELPPTQVVGQNELQRWKTEEDKSG